MITKEIWNEELKKDQVLQTVCNSVTGGWGRDAKTDDILGGFFKIKEELSCQNGFLLRGTRLIPPTTLRSQLIDFAHKGHPGISKTKSILRQTYWWPGMDLYVERVVRECNECSKCDKILKPRVQPMTVRTLPKEAWEVVVIDILGPIRYSSVDKYIIVLVDLFSRWPEIKVTNSIETRDIVLFLEGLFEKKGFPVILQSDNGVQFTSHKMVKFLESKGIVHKRSALYHPETNGVVERFNRVLKETIQRALSNNVSWEVEVKDKVKH